MDTSGKFVITVSRQLGSGGHTIAQKLSERLGVRFFDKELIQRLSHQFKLTPERIESLKGEKKLWLSDFLHLVVPAPTPGGFIGEENPYGKEFNTKITTDDIYLAETEILREIADEGSCIITGRSGFFALKGHPNKVDIFITAPKEKRIERVMRKQGLSRKLAEELIDKVDVQRENYVKRYTGTSRYDSRNYHLTMNVGGLSEDQAVELILDFIGGDSGYDTEM